MSEQNIIEYPVIVNKYLALKKISSRKEADRLLKLGKIKINDKLAEPGQMVNKNDKVVVDNDKQLYYLAYYKPKGIITHSPQAGERSIEDVLRFKEKVSPIGRLDKASEGLILLTNDGRVTERLLSPDFYHEKEYEVRVDKPLTPDFFKQVSRGIVLDDGYLTRGAETKQVGERDFLIILTEGKKHQIRRMCEVYGLRVLALKRWRIMNIELGELRVGEYRLLRGDELKTFLGLIEL